MVTPYALQVQPLDVGKAIGLYQQGEQDRVAQDQRTAQQDLAKDLPTAIGGDPDAQTRVVSAATRVHPELGMKLLDYMKNAPAEAIARKQKEMDAIGAATEGLPDNPTPQQWADFKARAGQLGIPSADLENLQPEHLGMLRSLSTTWRSARAADEAAALSVAQLKGVEAKTSVDTAMAKLWGQNGGTMTPYGPIPNTEPIAVPPPRGTPNAPGVTVAPIGPPPSAANGVVQEAGDPRGPVGTKLPATPTPTPAPAKPGFDWSKVPPDTNPTVRRIAERVAAGDDNAWAEIGPSSIRNPNAPLRNRVSAEVNRMLGMKGMGGADQVGLAMDRKAAQTEANRISSYIGGLSTAIEEVDRFGPLAVAAAKDYGNTPFPGVNALMQMYSQNTGDPKLRKLGLAVNSLSNAYALVATRGNPNVNGQVEAAKLFSKIDSWQALAAAARQAQTEGISAKASAVQALKDARNRINGIQQQPREPTPPFPDDTTPGNEIPTHTLHGRPIVVRGGAWVFQDDGKPAK